MNVVEPGLEQRASGKSKSFSVRSILQLPASQSSYLGSSELEERLKQSPTNPESMLTHDLYPQNQLRHLPLSSSSYQSGENQFPRRYSYSPQFAESEMNNAPGPRFSYSQENQVFRSSNDTSSAVTHDLSAGGTNTGMLSTSVATSSINSPPSRVQSFAAGTDKISDDMLYQKNCVNKPTECVFPANLQSTSDAYPHNYSMPEKSKFDLTAPGEASSTFQTDKVIRKSDSDVFLPDETNDHAKQANSWGMMQGGTTDLKYKGKYRTS